jgi:hypothetical protein
VPLVNDFDISPYAFLMRVFVCTSLLFKLALAYQRFFVEQNLFDNVYILLFIYYYLVVVYYFFIYYLYCCYLFVKIDIN